MRHPSSDKRAAQFMFASPRRAKHVRTSSCAKALARMSYTRGLASFFIVATPASNSLLNRCDQRRSSRSGGPEGRRNEGWVKGRVFKGPGSAAAVEGMATILHDNKQPRNIKRH